ncbi:MAG: malate dehydrogenase [Candidatus Omnitrophota bacterium]
MINKISIIGSGLVGSTLAFNILQRLPVVQLILVDIAPNLAQGIALDLEDTRGLSAFDTEIIATGDIHCIKNSDIIVVTCGLARKEGMTRLDLAKTNSQIAMKIAKDVKKLSPMSIVIVVTNPLDLITYVVRKYTGFERRRVLGMGSSLDTARFVNIIYKRAKISPQNIDAVVIGPHSKDMIPLSFAANIGGVALSKIVSRKQIDKAVEEVKSRGKTIVDYLKNHSAQFAPALACCKLIEAVVFNQNAIVPVSVLLKNEYGLSDICLGVPCVINRRGMEKVLQLDLSSHERKQLAKAASDFRRALEALGL